MLSILLLAATALAECPSPVTVFELTSTLDTANFAYLTMDPEGFASSMATAHADVACLSEPLPPTVVASFYLQAALEQFLAADEAGTVQAFRALLAVEPSWQLPENLAPPRHALRSAFAGARMVPNGSAQLLPTPNRGWLLVDGRKAESAPMDRPYLLQVMNSAGQPLVSDYLQPGDPLPAYESLPDKPHKALAATWRTPLLLTAAGSTLASGLLAGLALHTKSVYEDPSTPCDDLDGLRSQANTMVMGSIITGSLAVGTGVSAVLVGRF